MVRNDVREVLTTFLRLGCTSFGGPIAHLQYFRRTLVAERGWLDDADFARIVAFCSVLPGPTSSQVGMLIGLLRAGPGFALDLTGNGAAGRQRGKLGPDRDHA